MPDMPTGQGIAEQIKGIAIFNGEWRHNDEAKKAYQFYDRINHVIYQDTLPQAIIGFDDSGRLKKAGRYHYEGDDVSLPHHIDLVNGLTDLAMIISLIGHTCEMQSEVYSHKSNWYFSRYWKSCMKEVGLTAKSNGDIETINDEIFSPIYHQIYGFVLPDDVLANQYQQYIQGIKSKPEEPKTLLEVFSDDDESQVVSFVAKTKKKTWTKKFSCHCVKGQYNGTEGTYSFHAINVAPNTICGACGHEIKAVDAN